MSNLVERVAQAIYEADDSRYEWKMASDKMQAHTIKYATAAIAVVGAEVVDLTKHNLALEAELHRVRETLRATAAQDEREASNKGRP